MKKILFLAVVLVLANIMAFSLVKVTRSYGLKSYGSLNKAMAQDESSQGWECISDSFTNINVGWCEETQEDEYSYCDYYDISCWQVAGGEIPEDISCYMIYCYDGCSGLESLDSNC